jgi:hypothetical protein
MQPLGRYALPFATVMAMGCSTSKPWAGNPSGARYDWLRKQGIVERHEKAPAVDPKRGAVAEAIRPQPVPLAAHLPEPVDASITASANIAGDPSTCPVIAPEQPASTLRRMAPTCQDTTDYFEEEPRTWNAKAIAAAPVAAATLALGFGLQSVIILLVGGAIAFTLGLIGSRQCRDRGNRGKGFALSGMIIGGAALFLSLVVFIVAV